ncbi:MAG: hypothetical protein FWG17_07600 [Desulfovibrionaceae bacterium]|nr:hypothetical protein [Desulfovibrionaceae bacterium]
MNLNDLCVRFNILFCVASGSLVFWGYNMAYTSATTLALISLPVCLASAFGWHCAKTGRPLLWAMILAGAMIPLSVWIYLRTEQIFLCFPGLLGLGNLCMLPFLKKRSGEAS